jgi:hypothetical protein
VFGKKVSLITTSQRSWDVVKKTLIVVSPAPCGLLGYFLPKSGPELEFWGLRTFHGCQGSCRT